MNRKTALSHKKKKSRKLNALLWLITFAFVGVLIMFLFTLAGVDSIAEILGNSTYWYALGFVCGLLVVAYLMMYRIDAQNIAMNENDLEDTEWLTPKRLRNMKEFTVTTWNGMDRHADGIVIGAEKKGGGVEILTTDQLHALIVGTTGSGKTTGFVDQNIAVLARSKTKPSLVITDPKSELYAKHARQLESEGYKISVLDLREPYSSARWNPMNVLIRRIRLVKDLQNNLQNRDGKYYGAGEVFLSYRDARTRVQELKDEIYENAQDLVYTLCPVQNRDQPTWEQGARNLIFGLVLAFCEDCIKGKMDEKQLLLFNVYHNITRYCSEDTTALREYLLEGRDEFSKVRGLRRRLPRKSACMSTAMGSYTCPIALRADTRNTPVRSAARVIGIITRTERSTPIRKSWYNRLARTRVILRTFVPSAGTSTRTTIPPRSVMIIRTK